jgi:predicted Zn-dependent protease
MAEVFKDYDRDWPNAEREFQRALALSPNYATAHHWYAQLLVSLGRYQEAATHIELARNTDPLSPAINAYLPYIYLAARDYPRALHEATLAVELEPYSPLAHWVLGRAYLFSGDAQTAVSVLERGTELAGPLSMWEAALGFARARAGDRAGALAIVSTLHERAAHEFVSPYDLAVCYEGLGLSSGRRTGPEAEC